MESMALEMRLRLNAIKIWVLCHDMDGRLNIPRAIKVRCGITSLSNTYPWNTYSMHRGYIGLGMASKIVFTVCLIITQSILVF